MGTSEPETSAIVSEYLRERKEEMEEMHDAFGVEKPQEAGGSRTNKAACEKSQYEDIFSDGRHELGPLQADLRCVHSDFMTEFRKFGEYLDQVSRDRSVDFDQDVRDCEWSDALEKLQEADRAVAKRMKKDKTLLSKGAQVLTNMSNLLQPGLQAIPDELCILHGGLAFLFHASAFSDSVISAVYSNEEARVASQGPRENQTGHCEGL